MAVKKRQVKTKKAKKRGTLRKARRTGKKAAPKKRRESAPVRSDGRDCAELRPIGFERGYLEHAPGSVLTSFGQTRVLCTASIEESVPSFLRGSGRGWVTAEYGMLPAATHTRSRREAARGKQGGRTLEIQRLIGRSLRAVVDLEVLGERSIVIDCDVLQADGGTRTASITGAWIALWDAVEKLVSARLVETDSARKILRDQVAAVSVGVVGGRVLCDLCYEEDSSAQTDLNVVMTGSGGFVEIQGTAEGEPFSGQELSAMLESARQGISTLLSLQRRALGRRG